MVKHLGKDRARNGKNYGTRRSQAMTSKEKAAGTTCHIPFFRSETERLLQGEVKDSDETATVMVEGRKSMFQQEWARTENHLETGRAAAQPGGGPSLYL